jgi:4-amino-4-deoxychorismate lyase
VVSPSDPPKTSGIGSDRGLLYGDGAFRTFRHGATGIWDREGQYALLAHDCKALGFDAPSPQALDAAVAGAVSACEAAEQVVRVTVTRGSGPRGYRPPVGADPAIHAHAGPAPARVAWDAGYRLRTCDLRLGSQPRLAGIKHLNRLENVLARAEWDDPSIDDGILLGQSGEVVETVLANIFWRDGDTIFTPALNRAGVSGRQRARILEALRRDGADVVIGHFSAGKLSTADEAWVCNSVNGLRAVTAIDGRGMRTGATAGRLAAELFGDWQPGVA